MSKKKIGVLLMAYGSPDNLDDMEAYLNDIRGGRPMSPEFVAEFRGRYEQIGGKSPLNELTFEQAGHVEDVLKNTGVLFVPGWGFGRTLRNAVRISYGPLVNDIEKINVGFEKVASYLNK